MEAATAAARTLFGERFREARLAANLTQREIYEDTGVDIATISRIERGNWSPKLDTIAKLALAVRAEIVDLFRSRP